MPDMSSLASMLQGAGGGGAGGGAAGLSGLLNNPALQQMAQGMMQNPAMMQMAQSMMQNPEMMRNMMGSLGGGANAAEGPSSSTSHAAPSTPDLSGLLNPDVMARLGNSPEVARLRQDPDLHDFFRDVDAEGPMAAMR